MSQTAVARRYAQALLEICDEQKSHKDVQGQFDRLIVDRLVGRGYSDRGRRYRRRRRGDRWRRHGGRRNRGRGGLRW